MPETHPAARVAQHFARQHSITRRAGATASGPLLGADMSPSDSILPDTQIVRSQPARGNLLPAPQSRMHGFGAILVAKFKPE